MNIKELTSQEKLQILKDIFDSTDILITATYGEWERDISSKDMYLANEDDRSDGINIQKDKTIIIQTCICTG